MLRRAVITFIACSVLLAGWPQKAEPMTPAETEFARIGWHDIASPFGKFLLIKGRNGIGAVRFKEYRRGRDSKPATTWNSGEERHIAYYEWYFQADGSGDLTKKNVEHGSGDVSTGPIKGIGRFGFQTGSTYLKFGSVKAMWRQPDFISFFSGTSGRCEDAEYELAPTAWVMIADVKPNSPALKWFRCDDTRKSIVIPLAQLSGGQ
jgi:hypothetical protein